MYIATAVIETEEDGIETVVITDEKQGQDEKQLNGQNILYLGYEIPLADDILKAMAKDTVPIDFFRECRAPHDEKKKYTLKKFTSSSNERVYNKYRKNHIEYREKLLPLSTIYIYEHNCRCFTCFEKFGFGNLESFCGLIPLEKNREKLVSVDMHKCPRCRKIFVDSTSLSLYENRFGKLALNKNKVHYWITDDFKEEIYYEHAPDSILSRNGYTTSLPKWKRWEIIDALIEKGINKAAIKDHLAYLIKFHGRRCYKARPKWEMDLEHVNEYRIEEEERIRFY